MYFINSFSISSDFVLPSSFNCFKNPKQVAFLIVLKHLQLVFYLGSKSLYSSISISEEIMFIDSTLIQYLHS